MKKIVDALPIQQAVVRAANQIDSYMREREKWPQFLVDIIRGLIWAYSGEDPGDLNRVKKTSEFLVMVGFYRKMVGQPHEHDHLALEEDDLDLPCWRCKNLESMRGKKGESITSCG